MHEGASEQWTLIIVGAAMLAGFVAHVVGRRAHVPRVTLLLVIGVVAGPSVFDVVPHEVEVWFPHVSNAALSLIGFMLGQHFKASKLIKVGKLVLVASLAGTLVPAVIVALGLLWIAPSALVALLLAAVSSATAPAAVVDVVNELKARGPLTETTLDVTAIDDAWAVLLFTIVLAAAPLLAGEAFTWSIVGRGAVEIGGGLLLGVVLGLPMAWLTGRLKTGHLTFAESLGFVLVTGGLAALLNVSGLLACMALGTMVANFARHHRRAFHAVEGAMDPFLVVFFLLAGFELRLESLTALGQVGVAYVVLRTIGKVAGGYLGGWLGGGPPLVQRYLGWCLLPQAGVALGLGLVLANRYPEQGGAVLQLLVATTVLFELFGPIAARIAIVRAGEAYATD